MEDGPVDFAGVAIVAALSVVAKVFQAGPGAIEDDLLLPENRSERNVRFPNCITTTERVKRKTTPDEKIPYAAREPLKRRRDSA